MKLCKDCKHCLVHTYKGSGFFPRTIEAWRFATCTLFPNKVTGGKHHFEGGTLCKMARANDDLCGNNAKLWEAK